ncbi:hypothetical protein M6B38_416360 [Iris pallida]|uniref:Uncharacterized protein n=1 Tax=Iris pallida TaxID=29817 RepID=A0AAX6FKQ4_IRIPA|nr:hypothetical protein M6B38_416360 [Iris pallida]
MMTATDSSPTTEGEPSLQACLPPPQRSRHRVSPTGDKLHLSTVVISPVALRSSLTMATSLPSAGGPVPLRSTSTA